MSAEEADGISLDYDERHWAIDGVRTFDSLLLALRGWLPDGAVLYFEGGHLDAEIEAFMDRYSAPEETHVSMGTVWPRPRVFHVSADDTVLAELAGIMGHHAEPELAIHFHVYCDGEVLLQWHDAFMDPLQLSGAFGEDKVAEFASRLGVSYRSVVEPAD